MLFMKKSIKEYTYNMGAINSAFNQAAAAAAAAAVGINRIKEADIAAGVAAKDQALELMSEEGELRNEVAKVTSNKKAAEENVASLKDLNVDTSNPDDVQAFADLTNEAFNDLSAAEKAEKQLSLKIKAKQQLATRLQKTIDRAKRWTGGNE